MSTLVPITFDTLESALMWASSGMPFENTAFLSRATGALFLKSSLDDYGGEIPDDIDDGSAYIAMPHKNDLNLGRNLVFAFAEEHAPAHLHTIDSFFRRRGAYGKFKTFLERQRLLDRWYEFEALATKIALEQWAGENGFAVLPSKRLV